MKDVVEEQKEETREEETRVEIFEGVSRVIIPNSLGESGIEEMSILWIKPGHGIPPHKHESNSEQYIVTKGVVTINGENVFEGDVRLCEKGCSHCCYNNVMNDGDAIIFAIKYRH